MARRPVRHRHRHAKIRVVRIRRKGLRTIQHPDPIRTYRLRARTARVRSRLGLGQAPAADPLTGRELRQIAPLLFLVARHIEVIRTE